MCDRYSYRHGYICERCFSELVSRGVATDIEEFMRSPVEEIIPEENAEAYFDKIFIDHY